MEAGTKLGLRNAAVALVAAAAFGACTTAGAQTDPAVQPDRSQSGIELSVRGEEQVRGTEGPVASDDEPLTRLDGDPAASDAVPPPPAGGIAGRNPRRPALTTTTAPAADTEPPVAPRRQQAANPSVIDIPSIGVEASFVPLGLRDDGTIEVPREVEQVGWWRGGPEPGEQGPAVVLGHVDSQDGPAVFYRLRDLQLGDPIHIHREDGTTVTYLVETSESHAKDEFPTDAVYGPTPWPTLRLVTCGGVFDRSVRSYKDNFIVFATLYEGVPTTL